MDLIRTRKDRTQIHLLCNDHIPNFAMKNEFQTTTFSLKINQLEIHEEEYYGYVIEKGGVFLCIHLTLQNLTREPLSFSRYDFLVHYDRESEFEAESHFDVEEQFEDLFILQPFMTVSGKYVFIISENAKKIALKYYEIYEDQSVKEYRLRYRIEQ